MKIVVTTITILTVLLVLFATGATEMKISRAPRQSRDNPGNTVIEPKAANASTYYLSPDGDDSNNGSIEAPWRTLKYALTQLAPGEVLALRGGTYYENEIRTSISGTPAAPITIQSYPGERASIDGGFAWFKDTTKVEWELVNAGIALYRSKRTFSSEFIRAWLIDEDTQLVEYQDKENLESTNYDRLAGMSSYYMGPGVQLRADGRLYIRLQYNPHDLTDGLGNRMSPVAKNTSPSKNRIAVYNSRRILVLEGASYLHFKNVDFAHARYIMDVRNGSHHIELSGCNFNYGRFALMIRDNIHDWEIHHCEFNNGIPDYVYWADVKNWHREVAEAYPEFQSVAIGGAVSGFRIHHNVFRNGFDAISVKNGTIGARVTDNIFRDLKDDAINLYKGISEVEVAHNLIWHTAAGISNKSSAGTPGHVYIHHNIIDNSAWQRGGRPGNYREDRWPIWTVLAPFASHDRDSKPSWWKLYNNTIVTRRGGYKLHPAGPKSVTGNTEKYVYNNIFYILDDRIVFSDELASSGSHYNGNLVFRKAPGQLPLFMNFGNGESYFSLGDFREESGTQWEVHGLELDPGFDINQISDPHFEADSMWERYRPTNSQVCAGIAPYTELNWPGTAGVYYRGAVPPGEGDCVQALSTN